MEEKFDYELIVIGGGSGGISAAKEAGSILGPNKVCMLDFVKPTPFHGTTWGVGGTCVNVGCIPKKLCHHAALLGEYIEYSTHYGWTGFEKEKLKCSWDTLRENVQNHIRAINWGYRKNNLPDFNVKYINAFGSFVDKHTIQITDKKGSKNITGKNIVIAVGGRPIIPDIPGKELCITSDDLFKVEKHPGKTLVVGASYVALECGGFLKGIGSEVTIAVRSILLRGFDQQCAEIIGKYMETKRGIKFVRPAVVTKVEKLESGKLKATWSIEGEKGTEEGSDEFDTVLYAIGRTAVTKDLNLEKVGVKINEKNHKIIAENESTNVDNIYAIGDVLDGKLELTPVAIKAGKLLSQRLFNNAKKQMDYTNVPTTVFTPIEYGAIGLSEEDAIKQLGEENVEVYHSYYTPLEWTVGERGDNQCYVKLICNKKEKDRVVGFHVVGEHAGEITQGFAVGIKLGATKQDFDETVGIHPTSAEEFTTLHITKSSGEDPNKTTC